MAKVVEGGLSRVLNARELGALGYRLVLFTNTALRVTADAMLDAFPERCAADPRGPSEPMLSWPDRHALVGLYDRAAGRGS